jgi:hypothetical protein
LAELHRILSQFEESIGDYQLAENAARELGNHEAEVSAICSMGLALCMVHRYEEAGELGKRALALAQAAGSRAGMVSAQLVLGVEREVAGDLSAAEPF